MVANGKVRVACIGVGYWGRNIARNLSQLGALHCVVDADEARRDEIATANGTPGSSLEAALADPAIDAVAIATPARDHARIAIAAIESGKHVFVEKPLALTVASAEEVIRTAGRHSRIVMVGHILHYHPGYVGLKELVKTGRLGRLQYLYSNRLNLGKFRREEDILWSFAPHDISAILDLVGSEPESVDATGANFLHTRIADTTTTHLRFISGQQAHIFVSWLHPFKEQKLVVVGDRSMAVFDDGQPWESKLRLFPHRIEWQGDTPVPERVDSVAIEIEQSEPLRNELAHFLECVETGRAPRTDGYEGLRVLRVLERASSQLVGAKPPTAAATSEKPSYFKHESAYVDQPSDIGEGVKIWHFSHVLANTRIGAKSTLGQNVVAGPDVTIGAGCWIQNNVSIYKGVTLEDGVFCGPSCVFTNVLTPRAGISRKSEFNPTLVRKGATIGANATIVCGTTIGAYSMIAAGAVVTRDVPDHALVAGVPARRIGWVSHSGERLGSDLICPRENRKYRETSDGRLEEMA